MWNTTMTAVAAEFAYNIMDWRTAYVLTETSTEYHTSLTDYFVESFTHLGGEMIDVDTYIQGDLDASAQIQRYLALPEEPDVLFISSSMPDVGTIVRQFRAAGVETPILGGDSMDNEEFYVAVGDELSYDIYMSTHSWVGDDSADPKMGDFIELWTEEYGKPPEYAYNTMGWDVVYALKKGIEAAGTTEGKAVAKALEEIDLPGLSGSLNWSSAEDGHYPKKEAFVLEVQNGVVSFLYKTMPEWLPPLTEAE
jgi:branched-chain amino acid transport system substrate-binding protein